MTHDPLAATERDKYARMWSLPQYRRNAPGERHVSAAVKSLGMRPPESVIDFGCGTGRPALRLHERGFEVTAIDHVREALDAGPAAQLPRFVEACLWELPEDLRADWGFCTDTMEHVPPERVEATLTAIRRCCERGAYFQVACSPDSCGRLIGEELHLTVKSPAWWRDQLAAHWPSVELKSESGVNAFTRAVLVARAEEAT